MLNLNKFCVKATVKGIIVAFIYYLIITLTFYCFFKDDIKMIFSFVNLVSINTNEKILKDVKIDLNTKNLQNYPEYGSRYATLKISSLNIEKTVYFGDTLSILKYGIGHSSGSYFPGEGGSVVYMGHNTYNMLANLPNIKINDIITVQTTYGIYNYQVYETKVIDATDFSSIPIQREKEILMLYTCKKMPNIGYSTKRIVVYANLVED